jgi:hypothetical protein
MPGMTRAPGGAACCAPGRLWDMNCFYGGKLKDLSLVSTQTLTTFVFWLFSGSLFAMGMGEKGLMATRTSTLVLEPLGDLALRML